MIIDDIIHGISEKLKKIFPDIPVYYDEIEQKFKEPSFFIKVIRSDETQVLGSRYYREYDFDIAYFTKKNDNLDMFKMIDKLHNILEYIMTPEGYLLRGVDRRTDEVDDVLHYILAFHIYIYKSDGKERIFMENLKTNQNTRDGG